jgi:Chloramphenicol phosphotransferase-like protein
VIIFLAGSINSGKSTVAKLLVKELPECVNFEVDKICEFVDGIDRKDIEVLILENITSLIKDYANRKLNVVVSYTFADSTFEFVKDLLTDIDDKIYLFTLNPGVEIAAASRGDRKIDIDTAERVKYHYKLGINDLKNGITIDNSHQTPEETATEILNKISK